MREGIDRRQFLKSAVLGNISLATTRTTALPAPSQAEKEPTVLVENGRSIYSICVSQDASPSEQHAAQELQRFIQEMSGRRLGRGPFWAHPPVRQRRRGGSGEKVS